jgi:hypothetical protein
MRKVAGSLLVAVVLLGALRASASEGPGEYYKNERWGYRVRAPKGWTNAAMSAAEQWIASKHLAPNELQAKKPTKDGWFTSERPEMWVIGFPHARDNERGAKREDPAEGVSIFTIKNPYRDYKDFVKRESWFVGGGYYFSKEEEAEIDGAKVTQYEIKVEKMVDAPFRLVAWVYHADDVDFAIQFKIFEDYYADYAATFSACLRSFRRIDRTAALPGGAVTGKSVYEGKTEREMTPEERAKKREADVQQVIAREAAALPKDWSQLRTDHYVIFSHVDDKFTKRVADYAEAVRAYLDGTFPIGTDYVPPGILRVFASSAEETAFNQTSGESDSGGSVTVSGLPSGVGSFRSVVGWLDGGVPQVGICKDTGLMDRQWEFGNLSRRLTDLWISYRNRLLSNNMPMWIRDGLPEHVSHARNKGRKLEFAPDAWDRRSLAIAVAKGEVLPLKTLLQGDDDKFREHWNSEQAASVVAWLLGDGGRGKMKGAIQKYLATMITAVEEAEAEYEKKQDEADKAAEEKAKQDAEARAANGESKSDDDGSDDDDGKDAAAKKKAKAESENRWKEMDKLLNEKAKTIRDRAFDAAFGSLDDKDWARLDALWRKSVT